MSNFSFINWDDNKDTNEEAEKEPPPCKDKERGDGTNASDSAWEIKFSDKTNPMPKFLMDRQHAYSISRKESIKKDLDSPVPSRSSSSPVKVRGTKPVIKSSKYTPPVRSHTSPPKHFNSVPKQDQYVRRSLSPKKSPTIKKPLLTVTSPTKKPARSHDLKSQSECLLSPSSPNKPLRGKNDLGSDSRKKRPHSASSALLGDPQLRGDPSSSPGGSEIVRPDGEVVRTGPGVDTEEIDGGKRWKVNRPLSNKKIMDPNIETPQPQPRALPTLEVNTHHHHHHQSRLATTSAEMAQRKVLDLKRWYCMCHPQYAKSCGISSVVSCWNYLFSTLGNGSLPPLTQEEALDILGFQPPFGEIRFGPFTGNATCMRWFEELCDHYGMSGQSYYFYKPKGGRRTVGIHPHLALERLQDGLKSPDTTFIYHCYNHYFCPIGYEDVPKKASDAYRVDLCDEDVETWILIGEPSRKHPAIHVKRWEDIVKDLFCESPQYFNIRHPDKGVLLKHTKRTGNNLHCIMAFKKVKVSVCLPYKVESDSERSDIEELDSSDSDFRTTHQQGNDPNEGTLISSMDLENIDGAIGGENELTGASGLKRSGTFTKDKPSVLVDKTRTSSESDDSSVSSADTEDNEGRALTQPVSDLKRSGTFTKDTPAVVIQRRSSSEYDSDSSIDYGEVVVSEQRSNTFTKDSSMQSNEILSSPTSTSSPIGDKKRTSATIDTQTDLDDTLKAADLT